MSISEPAHYNYNTCISVFLNSDEKYSLGTFVLTLNARALNALPIIGQVSEILQIDKSESAMKGIADFILLEVFKVVGRADIYGLPLLKSQGWGLIPVSV